jgi:hypothetical protein
MSIKDNDLTLVLLNILRSERIISHTGHSSPGKPTSIMKITFIPILLLSGLLVASCSTTPQERIDANLPAFQKLAPQEQSLVLAGQISLGMTPEAVKLAWGDPDSISRGNLDGIPSERWIYQKGGSGFSFGVGGGVGHYHNGSSMIGTGIGTTFPISTIPPNTSYVLFSKGKVTAWEGSGH